MEISGLKGRSQFGAMCRVALPDSFFAFDGMIETMLYVLDDMGIYDAIIDRDVEDNFALFFDHDIMAEAVQKGAGREQAHEAIKEHVVATGPCRAKANPRMICQSDSQMMLVSLDTAEIKAVLDRSQIFLLAQKDGKLINLHRRQRNWWNVLEALEIKKGRLL